MTDPTTEELDALVKDAILAANCMAESGTFETGQGILRDCSTAITALRAERDMAVATREATQDALTLCRERAERAEAEVARLTAALDAERASSEYHLKEIQGCVEEFKDMPCHSLWVRLVQSFERAHAARREGGV